VDDGWLMSMQVHQPLQDLPGPALEHLLINVLVLLAVPAHNSSTSSGAVYATGFIPHMQHLHAGLTKYHRLTMLQ
jgi:hypothetical protein